MAIPVGGMEGLIRVLVGRLSEDPNVTLRLNSEVVSIPEDENVILCVPAQAAARLLKAVCPTTAKQLATVAYAPIVSVTVLANRRDFVRVPQGTGVLIPPKEEREVLGILFCSSSFPSLAASKDQVVLRVMIGGTRNPGIIGYSEGEIKSVVARELKSLFGFTTNTDTYFKIYRWPEAIPIYSPALIQLKDDLPWCNTAGRAIFGNFTGKVSIRGMIEEVIALRSKSSQEWRESTPLL
jgi:protoporphyrinogen oxidase